MGDWCYREEGAYSILPKETDQRLTASIKYRLSKGIAIGNTQQGVKSSLPFSQNDSAYFSRVAV